MRSRSLCNEISAREQVGRVSSRDSSWMAAMLLDAGSLDFNFISWDLLHVWYCYGISALSFQLFFSGIFVVLREQGHPDVGAYKGAGSSLRLRCSIWTSTSTRSESSFGSILLLFSVFIQRLVSSVRQRRVVCVEQAAFFLWERLRDSALRAKMVSSVVSASGDTLFPSTNVCGLLWSIHAF